MGSFPGFVYGCANRSGVCVFVGFVLNEIVEAVRLYLVKSFDGQGIKKGLGRRGNPDFFALIPPKDMMARDQHDPRRIGLVRHAAMPQTHVAHQQITFLRAAADWRTDFPPGLQPGRWHLDIVPLPNRSIQMRTWPKLDGAVLRSRSRGFRK